MRRNTRTPLQTFNLVPPAICRFLARKGKGKAQRPMSHRDIIRRSGLSRKAVRRLSRLDRWDNVPLSVVSRFSIACGINLREPRRHLKNLLRGAKRYLNNATKTQRLMLDRCLTRITRPGG